MTTLITCPFCNDPDARTTTGPAPDLWGVICDECGCFLDCRAISEAVAVERWNHRPATTPEPTP